MATVDFAVGIGGENGQGIASTGDILARIFARRGLNLNAYNAYQSIIRGGHTFLTIRASDGPVRSMGDKIDVFIPLNQDTMDRHLKLLKAGACAIYDNEKVKPGTPEPGVQLCPMPMKDLTKGNKLAANTAALGATLQLLGIESEPLEAVVTRQFKKKGDAVVAENIAIARAGFDYAAKNFKSFPWKTPRGAKGLGVITGNQATAMGGVAAGVKFYAAYPMSPSTGVLMWMAQHARQLGIMVRQVEDEIGVMNMVIGAAHTGCRAMCATSGGGFALMSEAIGMSGMIETPMVCVDVQRAGPATGVPTKTEQGDLWQILGAGQGDYPRIIVAPASQLDLFRMVPELFNLCDKYQCPGLVLADLLISEGTSSIDPADLDFNQKIERGEIIFPNGNGNGNGAAENPFGGYNDSSYLRYKNTASGVSCARSHRRRGALDGRRLRGSRRRWPGARPPSRRSDGSADVRRARPTRVRRLLQSPGRADSPRPRAGSTAPARASRRGGRASRRARTRGGPPIDLSPGLAIKRLEDPPLVTGRGRYVDDVVRAGMLHAVVVRSAYAHARLRDVDVSRAAAHPGVIACLTARDLHPVPRIPIRQGGKPGYAAYLQSPLATDRVRYVGEPVAVIVATDPAAAVDARELVQIVCDEMPAVVDPGDAMREGTTRLFDDANVADSWTTTVGDVDAALHGAACVVTERLSMGRLTGVPLEPRGLVAEWDAGANRLTVWGPTKIPYFNRRTLATLLELDEMQIDFVACDVGGGFGVRGEFYPEDFLIPHLARRLGRPVKWVEDRREHLLTINHSRQNEWSVTLAADARGRLLALDATLVNVMGGYLRPHGVWVPALTTAYLAGPYRVPAFRCRVSCVMTNRTPTGSVRSPGFYEGAFVRERMMDVLAARVGCDPAEIRRRNLAAPGDGGYSVNAVAMSVIGREADFTGEDFGAMFEQALKASQYDAHLAACRKRNEAGGAIRYGVGLAAVVETSGVGPFESARVALTADGTITLACGATPVGQGIQTALAQVCADVLTVPPAEIDMHLGDTRWMPHGVGSSASRSMVMAGNAVHGAAVRVRERIIALAAERFEASPDDVTLHDGAAIVRGLPDRRCTLREIAAMAPEPVQAEWRHETTKSLGSMSVHVCVVGVDTITGEVHPETYFVLCDVGRAINPAIVDGQLVGGVIYGLGHAMMEELVYDASGQLVTGTLMDYALPRADGLPTVEIVRHDVPAPSNPLGVKGAGEAGTSGAGAALANAVANAVGPAAARHLPITASRVLAALDGTTPPS